MFWVYLSIYVSNLHRSCQGKIGILENKLSNFLAVTAFHINRFGLSQVFGVCKCFHQG